MNDEQIIKREIEKADESNPVTSTRLIDTVFDEIGVTLTQRRIRKIVENLR